jgi:hypothetical protein
LQRATRRCRNEHPARQQRRSEGIRVDLFLVSFPDAGQRRPVET